MFLVQARQYHTVNKKCSICGTSKKENARADDGCNFVVFGRDSVFC